MKNFPIKLCAYFLMAIPLFVACEKENVLRDIDPSLQVTPAFLKNEDKYLEFSSRQAFSDSVKLLSTLTRYQLDRWEDEKGFVSLRRMYETIIDQESAQIDLEEEKVRRNPNLLKTLRHTYSPLLERVGDMLTVSTQEGIGYKLFNPAYASLLNKKGIVKIGPALYKFGDNYIKQIMNGDEREISKLATLNQSNQTENLKYYEVKTNITFLKNERAKINNNERRCDAENMPGDLRLVGLSRGTSYYFIDPSYSLSWLCHAEIQIEMRFLRRTIFGWNNHRTESYTTFGTWYGIPIGHIPSPPPSLPVSYNYPPNFAGKTAHLTIVLWGALYSVPDPPQASGVDIGGTQNFIFADMNCYTPVP